MSKQFAFPRWLPELLAAARLVLCAGLIWLDGPFEAQAQQQRINGAECRAEYRKWQRAPMIRAYSLSRDGLACGSATGYQTTGDAERAANASCAKHGRGCRVIASSGLAKTPQSKGCRDALTKWREGGEVFRAFAISANGHGCAWSPNAASREDGEAAALAECSKKNKGCRIVESHEPVEVLKDRQRQLQVLGYYKGEIDGVWGASSRSALEAFAGETGLDPKEGIRRIFGELSVAARSTSKPSVAVARNPDSSIQLTQSSEQKKKSFLMTQKHLHTLGLYQGKVDGVWGPTSATAYATFAQKVGLDPVRDLNRVVAILFSAAELIPQSGLSATQAIETAKRIDRLGEEIPIGNDMVRSGRLKEAELLFKRLLDEYVFLVGERNRTTAVVLSNLAQSVYRQGRIDEAEKLNLRALRIRQELFGEDDKDTMQSLSNLALIYQSQGRIADSKNINSRLIISRERVLGSDNIDTVASMQNLGNDYYYDRQYDKAESLYLRALQVHEKDKLPDIRNKMLIVFNLSNIYRAKGQFAEAEKFGLRAQRELENKFGIEDIDVIFAYSGLAHTYLKQNRNVEAARIYERIMAQYARLLGDWHPQTLAVADNLAIAYHNQNMHIEAVEIRENMLRYLPQLFASGLIEASLENYRSIPIALDQYFLWRFMAGRLSMQEQARRSFEGQGWWKYGRIDAALADLGARLSTGDESQTVLVRQFQEARDKLKLSRASIARSFDDPTAGITSRKYISSVISADEQQFDALRIRLEQSFPAFAELSLPRSLRADEAQELLRPREGLVAYAQTERALHIWFVTRDRVEWKTLLLLAHPQLRSLVQDLAGSVDLTKTRSSRNVEPRCSVTSTVPGMEGRDFDACKSKELYDLALGGFDLTGLDQLIIVPDGPLETIPFSMLVTGFHADGRPKWLIEDYGISMLPTTSSLRALRQDKARASDPAQKSYLGVAPVTFGNRDLASTLRSALEDLPGTENEVRYLSGLLGGGTEGYVTGKAASEGYIKTAALDQYRVLSFATHGLMSKQSVDLTGGKITEPALVLAPSEGEDGLLTATEAASLRLDADWVLLSGCNTAAGSGENAEGLSGLARAFFFAGARALLVSHWSIDDNAAMDVMVETMKRATNDKTLGKAQALRQAMLTVMQKPGYNHPFFWAPFSLIGVDNDVVGTRAASEPETPGRKLTNAEQTQIKALLGVAKKTAASGKLDGAASDYASSRKAKEAKSGRPIMVEPTESEAAQPATSTEKAQNCCSFDLTSLKRKLAGCWSIPPGGSGQRKAIFVDVALSRSGDIVTEPRVDADLMTGPDRVLAQSAIRAVKKCAPYSLPEAHYDEWKNLRINFETQAMR